MCRERKDSSGFATDIKIFDNGFWYSFGEATAWRVTAQDVFETVKMSGSCSILLRKTGLGEKTHV